MTTKLNANGTSLALSVPTGSSTTPAPDRDAIDPSLNDKNSSPLANHKVPESVETLSKGSLEPTVYPSKPLIIPATLTSPANSRVSKPKRDGKPNFRRGSATGKSGDPKDKRKPVVACIACRKKKIKCSSDRPACSNCLRVNILCEYPAIRNRGSRFGYMEMLNRRLNHLEKYINCSTNPDYYPQFVKIHQKPRDVDQNQAGQHLSEQDLATESQSGSKSFTDQITQLAPNVPQIPHPNTTARDTTISDSIELPPMDIIIHLVELYFRHVHGQTYSFLHKPTLLPRIYKNQVNKGLVLALCGLTARFSRHPAVAMRIPYLAGETFVSKARRIISMEFDDPTIETVQSMILLIQHDFFRSKGKKSMIYISMAIRMATTLGLHEESPDPSLTFLEREQRRRTYWSLVVLDRLGHSASHWHVQLRADIVDIQMPCTDYCFENSIPVVTQKLNGDPPPPIKLSRGLQYPAYPKGKLGLYSYIVKVTILWCDINKYVMEGYRQESIPPWEPGSKFSELETRLQNLFSELPKEYQYSRERLIALDTVNQGGALVHLHGELLMSLCYLNRVMYPYNYKKMKFSTPPPASFIERAAINIMASAKAQSSMIEDVLMMEDFNMAPFVGFGVFAVSSVHIANSFSSDPVVATAAKNNLAINLKFLVVMREYWYSVGVWCIILKDRYFQKARRHKLRAQLGVKSNRTSIDNESNGDVIPKSGDGNDEDDNDKNKIIPDGFSRPGTPPLAYAPDGLMNVDAKKSQQNDSSGYSSPGPMSSLVDKWIGTKNEDKPLFDKADETMEMDIDDTQKDKEVLTPRSSAFARTWSRAMYKHDSKPKTLQDQDTLLKDEKMEAGANYPDPSTPSQFADILTMRITDSLLSKTGSLQGGQKKTAFEELNEVNNHPAITGVSSTSRNNLLTDTSGEWLNSIDPCDFQQLTDNKNLEDPASIGWVNNSLFSSFLGDGEGIEEESKQNLLTAMMSNQRLQQLVMQEFKSQALEKKTECSPPNDASDDGLSPFSRSSSSKPVEQEEKPRDTSVVDESLFKNSILHQPFMPSVSSSETTKTLAGVQKQVVKPPLAATAEWPSTPFVHQRLDPLVDGNEPHPHTGYAPPAEDMDFEMLDSQIRKLLQPNAPALPFDATQNDEPASYQTYFDPANLAALSSGQATLLDEIFRQVSENRQCESDDASTVNTETLGNEGAD